MPSARLIRELKLATMTTVCVPSCSVSCPGQSGAMHTDLQQKVPAVGEGKFAVVENALENNMYLCIYVFLYLNVVFNKQ